MWQTYGREIVFKHFLWRLLRLAVISVTHFAILISYRRQKRSGNVKITVTKSSLQENATGRRFRFFPDKKQMSKRTEMLHEKSLAVLPVISFLQENEMIEPRGCGSMGGVGGKRKKLSVAMKCLFNSTEKMTHVRNVL